MFIFQCDAKNRIKYISELKSSSPFYEYNISNEVIKKNANFIPIPLAIILNLAIRTSVFPSCFKKTVIIPLHKNDDELTCRNYRPISLTLSIAKIFEKCLKDKLLHFLNKIINMVLDLEDLHQML